jgi:hypothetical protein
MQQRPVTLAYRTPPAGGERCRRILNELIASESLGWAGAVGKVAVGVPLCLVGPFFVAAVLKSIEIRAGADFLPGFAATWALATLVIVPLLMRLERRTRGEFLCDAHRGETPPYEASSYGEYQLQSTRFLWTAYTEIALLGPRLLWAFIDWVMQRPAADAGTRAAAAAVVADLFDAGQGVPVRQLVRPDRPPDTVRAAVRYLVDRDWVGTSKRGDRVWLLTPVRERLGRG